ncbi:carbohydrate ABC transporter permease [Gracilibacillus phocaeensis]|uniref:carbohydrate ABC transporter permease n=1 Tax=Gracilibacillus phocaeensis TaxID=2042304 RepID=UPI0010301A6C|nr:sugar ABC transporter permease [Gracilibacillus phocaeensis]
MKPTQVTVNNSISKIDKPSNNKSMMRIFLLPGVIVVAVVTQLPFLITIIFSLFRYNIQNPSQNGFAGISNFISVFQNPSFYSALLNLLVMTLASVVICAILGMMFALLLNRKFIGVNIIRTLVIMPLFVMDAVIGVIWRTLMLNSSFGLNAVIGDFIGTGAVEFFSKYPLQTIIMLIVWQWTPFFVLVFLAGVQSIPNEIEDSAKVDGAFGVKKFFLIDIPLMQYHIQVAVMLGLVFILKVFGLIYVTTNGGPGIASTNLPFYSYRITFFQWDVGLASVVAVASVIVSLMLLLSIFKLLQSRMGEN